jgi:hypothetical protein
MRRTPNPRACHDLAVKLRIAGLGLALVAITGCADLIPIPTPPPLVSPAGPQIDAATWAVAMCQSVDQLEQAVGDPTTGQRSAAWQELETALTGGDEARLKAAASGVLGHLTEGSRLAASATGFPPGSGAASELQALHDELVDGVRTMRDGTLGSSVEQVNEGRNLVDAAYEGHYEQALGQMRQVPLGGFPLPCG